MQINILFQIVFRHHEIILLSNLLYRTPKHTIVIMQLCLIFASSITHPKNFFKEQQLKNRKKTKNGIHSVIHTRHKFTTSRYEKNEKSSQISCFLLKF